MWVGEDRKAGAGWWMRGFERVREGEWKGVEEGASMDERVHEGMHDRM